MTKDEFRPVARLLMNCYGASRFTPDALNDWYELLKDLPGERVLEATKELIKSTNFPTIADIRGKVPHTVDSGYYQDAHEDIFSIRVAVARHMRSHQVPEAVPAALAMSDAEAIAYYRENVRPENERAS